MSLTVNCKATLPQIRWDYDDSQPIEIIRKDYISGWTVPLISISPVNVNGNTAYTMPGDCPLTPERTWIIEELRFDTTTSNMLSNTTVEVNQIADLNALVADLPFH